MEEKYGKCVGKYNEKDVDTLENVAYKIAKYGRFLRMFKEASISINKILMLMPNNANSVCN